MPSRVNFVAKHRTVTKIKLVCVKKKTYSLYSFLTLVWKTITHDIFHRKELFFPIVAEMFRIKSITVKAEGCG